MRTSKQSVWVLWFIVACGGTTDSPEDQGCSVSNPAECDAGQTSEEVPDARATDANSSGGSGTTSTGPDAHVPDSSVVTLPDATVTGMLPDGALVECCPISEEPDCCMNYGGANVYGCGLTCDGMPWPNDDWTRGEDEFGCPIWVEPPRTADVCGAIVPELDAGKDAQADADPDAQTDADIDAQTDADTDGATVECCPLSPEPDCCMEYGGANVDGCWTTCDGMPWPSDDWTRGEDEFGCPIWVEPPRTDDFCGAMPPDPDAGKDAQVDDDIDAQAP